ncbi:hypothetical protein AVEN_255865-1 [Araneus ventricosus]|uniref:Gustatory receptor n=1 Tax=Araneus ventricosus TaxID=182803 RepID=A0A4Y2DEY1_ARAVE|nr:hypothetical protein AVEN_255865-1 [Araneus ventricosus]
MKMYTSLFKLVHDLQDAISLPCFFILLTQITVLFYTIASFLMKMSHALPTNLAIRNAVILLMMPLSVIAIFLCASRINAYFEKIRTAIVLLEDRLVTEGNYDADVAYYLRSMREKSFPIMSACGVVELTPNVMIGMFASIFSYSLLILNLKN